MKILVTGASGDIGEAVGRILAAEFPDAERAGCDATNTWPGAFIFPSMTTVPPARDGGYLAALRALAAGFDLVIPMSEPEIAVLAGQAGTLAPARVLMVAPELALTFVDKQRTADFFQAHDIPTPRTWPLADAPSSALPLYVKPRFGAGSKGHRIVRTTAELERARHEAGAACIAQELLDQPDEEYTCGLCRLDGETRSIVLRRRLQGGLTAVAEVRHVPEIIAVLDRIAVASSLDGCINVQLRLTPHGPRVFEINPRLSSTVMMRHQMGFTDCVWWIRHRLGQPMGSYTAPAEGTTAYRMSMERILTPGMRERRHIHT